jgi:6-phosphofructokinase 1
LKYINPTYMVRAVAANAADNLYCTLLAHSAAPWRGTRVSCRDRSTDNGSNGYIPVVDVAEARNHVDTKDYKWAWVRSVMNQPDFIQSMEVQALTGLYKAM